MKKIMFILIIALFWISSNPGYSQTTTSMYYNCNNTGDWEIVSLSGGIMTCGDWEDSFYDDFSGNLDKWEYSRPLFNGSAEDLKMEYNVSIDNGELKLKAQYEDVWYFDKDLWKNIYRDASGAGIQGVDRFSYGKYEIECKLADNLGENLDGKRRVDILSTAFWLGGFGGEIDLPDWGKNGYFEFSSHNEHELSPESSSLCSEIQQCTTDVDLSAGYHKFAVSWTPFKMEFYFDDDLYNTVYHYYSMDLVPLDIECGDMVPNGNFKVNPAFPESENLFFPLIGVTPRAACYEDPNIDCDSFVDPTEWAGVAGTLDDYSDIPRETFVKYVKIDERKYYWCDGDDLIVPKNSTITITGVNNYGNITVEDGATLIIENANLKFGDSRELIVKDGGNLTIKNSTLDAMCNQWKGINARWTLTGNPGMIELDIATILNAKIGLKMEGGKKLDMKNCTFKFCDIGLRCYNTVTTKNILNTTFEQNDLAIFHKKESNHLIIDDSYFISNNNAIRLVDSYMNIRSGNTFRNNISSTISVEGTYTTSSGINIGLEGGVRNKFFDNYINSDIRSAGSTHPLKIGVINNLFRGGRQAGKFWGANKANFVNNTVESMNFGVEFSATGLLNPNNFKCNLFNDNSYCESIFTGVNRKTQFLENHFTGTPWINALFVDGADLGDEIGTINNSASNCFSSLNNYSLDVVTDENVSFNYYHKDNSGVADCQTPTNPGNYMPEPANDVGDYCSGDIGIFFIIDPNDDGIDGVDLDTLNPDNVCVPCILDSVDTWIINVVDDGGDDITTPEDEETDPTDPELEESEETLDQWINFGLYIALETENYSFAEELLNPLVTWRWRKHLFGVNVRQKKYEEARQILEAMSERNQNEIYYKQVQTINLKRLNNLELGRWAEEQGNWSITQNELDQLAMIAVSKQPSKGYAWSLYRLLTDIELPMDAPQIGDFGYRSEDSEIKDISLSNQNATYGIYPNPTNDELNIRFDPTDKINEVKIYSTRGEVIYSKKMNISSAKLDMSSFDSGIYFISVFLDCGKTINEKLIIN